MNIAKYNHSVDDLIKIAYNIAPSDNHKNFLTSLINNHHYNIIRLQEDMNHDDLFNNDFGSICLLIATQKGDGHTLSGLDCFSGSSAISMKDEDRLTLAAWAVINCSSKRLEQLQEYNWMNLWSTPAFNKYFSSENRSISVGEYGLIFSSNNFNFLLDQLAKDLNFKLEKFVKEEKYDKLMDKKDAPLFKLDMVKSPFIISNLIQSGKINNEDIPIMEKRINDIYSVYIGTLFKDIKQENILANINNKYHPYFLFQHSDLKAKGKFIEFICNKCTQNLNEEDLKRILEKDINTFIFIAQRDEYNDKLSDMVKLFYNNKIVKMVLTQSVKSQLATDVRQINKILLKKIKKNNIDIFNQFSQSIKDTINKKTANMTMEDVDKILLLMSLQEHLYAKSAKENKRKM